MNFNQLRFAAAAAATASFSKAAEQCHVAQPTLSNGIAQLEDQLGGKLFARTTRRVGLTAFGERMVPHIEAVLQAHGELQAAAQTYLDPSHQMLRVGLSPLIDAALLHHVAVPYRTDYPDAEIFFKEILLLEEMEAKLRRSQLDVIFRPYLPSYRCPRDLAKITFYNEDYYYIPKGDDSAPTVDGRVRLRDIANEAIIISHGGCGLATSTRQLFVDDGLEIREYNTQTTSLQVMQEWARLGIGGTILPKSRISREHLDRAKPLVSSDGKPVRLRIECYWARNATCSAHIKAFVDHLRGDGPALAVSYLGRDPSGEPLLLAS